MAKKTEFMQKILVLTSTFPRWNEDTEPPFVFELCKQLAGSFDVYVLAPHSAGALERETWDGLKIVRFRYFFEAFETLCYQGGILARLQAQPSRYLLIPFFIGFQLIAAYRLMKSENIQLIHAHWLIPQGLIACILRRLIRKPVGILCTSHGGDLFSLRGKIARFLKKRVLLDADAISVVNSVMANEVHAICQPIKPNVSVIPMGVDFDNVFVPSALEKKPFSLLFVGRLVEKKGVEYLIRALPAILQQFPETQLTVIGTGPELSHLQALVSDLHLQNHVAFEGAVLNTDLPSYYQQHQIAVFPFIVADNGDREGLPVVISEAIGCGCCVVTTDLPGIEDIIIHDEDGLVIPQKDSQALAGTLVQLFSHPEKIERLSRSALKNIRGKQNWRTIGQRYCDVFNRLINNQASITPSP